MSNSGFTKVSNLAGHMSDLNVSDLKVNSLQVNDIHQQGLQNYSRVVLTGYAPAGWNTAALAAVAALLTAPGQVQAPNNSNVLQLPDNALLESVQLDSNGTALAPITNTVALDLSLTAVPVAVTGLVTAALNETINGNATGTANEGPAIASFLSAGALPSPAALPTAYSLVKIDQAVSSFPMITQGVAANTAGDLAVHFTLLVPN